MEGGFVLFLEGVVTYSVRAIAAGWTLPQPSPLGKVTERSEVG